MQTFKNITGALVVYALYLIAIVLCYGLDAFTSGEVPVWAIVVLCSSLAAFLLWYVLGEWVIWPDAPKAKWLVTWWLLFIAVGVVAAVVCFREAIDQTQNADSYPALHLCGGLGAFYIASVLFSPDFARHRIWPAGLIHK